MAAPMKKITWSEEDVQKHVGSQVRGQKKTYKNTSGHKSVSRRRRTEKRRVTSPWSEEDVQKMIPIKPGLPQVGKPRI